MAARPTNPSYWITSTPATDYPHLPGDTTADVVVLGGGIAGLTAAYLLKKAGRKVVVVEMKEIGRGVTGYTTAKISSNHELVYTKLGGKHGEDAAQLYGEANEWAIQKIADLVKELKIDCDFRRQAAYTYAESPAKTVKVQEEAALAARLGLPASFTDEVPLPYQTYGAIRYENQAEFHPRKYLLGLAEAIDGDGSVVYERTKALDVHEGKEGCTVETDRGLVRARHVVCATHYPFLDRGLFFAKVHPHREYVVGAYLNGPVPPGMHLSTENSPHTIRSQPTPDGDLLIVLGEKHTPGIGDERAHYAALEAWTREHFDVKSVPYRWSTQDNWPVDLLPYCGELTPGSQISVITGLKGWGMTLGTVGAQIVADAITGHANPYARLFSPNRLNPSASAQAAILENAKVGLRFVADHLNRGARLPVELLAEGEGKILSLGGERVAVYRDDDGQLHGVSPVCTHLACTVKFNNAEKTWDCPCHGSRFDHTGKVIQGPATKNLTKKL